MTALVVSANPLHFAQMAELLNDIIAAGGTTAISEAVTKDEIQKWTERNSPSSAWHVAENDQGNVLGFQWIEPADYLPNDAAEIATFTKTGYTGMGIGTALFEATCQAARRLGYRWINANIRSDNAGGLAYYQSRGFETYHTKKNVTLASGLVVDKTLKRFEV
ncbi:MAG: GNAT family N-acetyltransferase [Pseudomonadota bacterium]